MSAPVRVSSWNSWDPLRRVIVGRADGTMVQAPEPAISRDWPDHGFPLGTYGPIPPDMAAAAAEQLDNLACLLRHRGIQVDRPEPLDFSRPVSTPLWTHGSMFGCAPPRDVLITVGNEILESTMSYRSRWFEYLCYRPLIENYYRSDPDTRWEAAPKPRLTSASYHAGFWDEYRQLSRAEQIQRVRAGHLVLTETEPLFDADAIRPMHIDATWVPLRPGLGADRSVHERPQHRRRARLPVLHPLLRPELGHRRTPGGLGRPYQGTPVTGSMQP